MKPWTGRAVTASVASLIGLVPHGADDVANGALSGFMISPTALAWGFGALVTGTVFAAVWGAAGSRRAMQTVRAAGMAWVVVALADHWRAFTPLDFRDGLSTRMWVWLIVGLQGAAAVCAHRALERELVDDPSTEPVREWLGAVVLVLALLGPVAGLTGDVLTRCREPDSGRPPDALVTSDDPSPAHRCPFKHGSFQGRVTDLVGHPVAGAFIDVTGGSGAIPGIGILTDDEGFYSFGAGLEPGTYSVRVGKDDYRSSEKTVRIDAGQITLVDFLLEDYPG